jgi:hypothetical protein
VLRGEDRSAQIYGALREDLVRARELRTHESPQ